MNPSDAYKMQLRKWPEISTKMVYLYFRLIGAIWDYEFEPLLVATGINIPK